MLAGRYGIRLSLAGAQDKLPVVFDGQRIGLPKGGQPSTHHDHLTPKMARKLGSQYRLLEVQARHWTQFAGAAALSKDRTRKRVPRMAQELPAASRQLQAPPAFADQTTVARIVALIEQRSALTF